jgi:signal transduction histidine kinase
MATDMRVPPPHLGAEFDEIAQDFNIVGSLSTTEQAATLVAARRVSLDRLVATAIAGFEPRYRAKGVLLESLVRKGFPVRADAERLGQILGNLLDNALRHTLSGDRIEVSAIEVHDGSAIVISDTGDGVSAVHLPHLFDRFYRADAALATTPVEEPLKLPMPAEGTDSLPTALISQ